MDVSAQGPVQPGRSRLGSSTSLRRSLIPTKTTPKGGTLDDFRLKALARFDPAHPLAGEPNLQTFSLFGREDLIAATSDDYQPTACPPAKGTGEVLNEIVQRARKTSVVIINEGHERSEHRGFTPALLGPLHAEGYTAR